MKTIIYNGNKIEIKSIGTEKIFYNGVLVSSKLSLMGATHVFKVNEKNEEIQYEVSLGTKWHGFPWAEVRRSGLVIYTDR